MIVNNSRRNSDFLPAPTGRRISARPMAPLLVCVPLVGPSARGPFRSRALPLAGPSARCLPLTHEPARRAHSDSSLVRAVTRRERRQEGAAIGPISRCRVCRYPRHTKFRHELTRLRRFAIPAAGSPPPACLCHWEARPLICAAARYSDRSRSSAAFGAALGDIDATGTRGCHLVRLPARTAGEPDPFRLTRRVTRRCPGRPG
jgi:hypothetical protein